MNFLITTKHYLKRFFTNPLEVALMTLLPAGIIFINILVFDNIANEAGADNMYNSYNLAATAITMMILFMFQLMSGVYAGQSIFVDLRQDRRWRLMAAPVPMSTYVFGAIAASMIFSLTTAALILGVSFFAFNIFLGNIAIVVVAVFLIALMSQFIGIIISFFAKSKGAIDGIVMAISFTMSAMVGGFLINIPVPQFIRENIIPTGVAFRAVGVYDPINTIAGYRMNDSLIAIGILIGMTFLLGIVTLVIARRRPF
ncbi:MAG: ABC transporter permease [Defluviitaleaceae bacterium]|nr:ABC transporter permease [Defluviitaleaceae bacterium]